MMSEKDFSGPAFPSETSQYGPVLGMTMRDYFAAKVDVSVYAPVDTLYRKLGRNPTVNELAEYIAEIRFIEADFMITERAK